MKATTLVVCLLALTSPLRAAPETVEEILAAVRDSGYAGRRDAIRAAADRSEPEITEMLLAVARSDPHPNIRSFALDALAGREDDRIVPLCLEVLERDDSISPRGSALQTLGRSRDSRAHPVLRAALDDPDLRFHAVVGLGLFGDPADFDSILERWRADPDDPWLATGVPEALHRLDPERARDLFLSGFADLSPSARIAVTEILREHPDDAVRERMTALLGVEEAGVRAAAVRVLGRAGNAATVPALIARLGGSDAAGAAAVEALAELGDPRAAPALARSLAVEDDPVAVVRQIGALARLGDPRAVADLVPLLDDGRVSRQPVRISSIRGYPYNVRVADAALWAVVKLAKGEEPCPREELSGFPEPPPASWAEGLLTVIRAWWRDHAEDSRYRFPE